MPTLHVRNVPDELYERLRERALADNRSLSAEVVTLLAGAIERRSEPEAALFERIRRRRLSLFEASGRFPSSIDPPCEDRGRRA